VPARPRRCLATPSPLPPRRHCSPVRLRTYTSGYGSLLTRKSAVPQPQLHPHPQPSLRVVPPVEETRESFGALLERLTAVVWEADPATLRLTFVSRNAEELLDYPLAAWLEEPGFREQVIHRADRARVRDELLSLGAGDHVLEYRMVRA